MNNLWQYNNNAEYKLVVTYTGLWATVVFASCACILNDPESTDPYKIIEMNDSFYDLLCVVPF